MYRTTTMNDYAIESDYPNLRRILAEDYAYLSDAELEQELEPVLGDMSLEEYESFMSDLSRFGRRAGNVLSRAAPGALSGAISGATAGAALGPYGMLAGALGGAALGGFQSYQASRQPRPAQPRPTQPAPTTTPAAAPSPVTPRQPVSPTPATAMPVTAPATSTQGGTAAGQLLSVLTRPETLQALQAMMMSQRGRRTVQVGNTQVPVAAFSNLISILAQRSAGQQNAVVAREVQTTPEYLTNESGEFICDPMDAEQRADVLMSMLNADSETYVFEDDFEDEEEYEDIDDLEDEEYEDLGDLEDEDDFDMEDEDDELLWEEELDELLA